jgi:tRNA (Thr-GGU) A37 N-methylase
VLATRSPRHPNPIALSLVELVAVEPGALRIRGIDLVDGTPVLDVKPYVPLFDARDEVRTGWFGAAAERVRTVRSDRRYGA